MNDDIENNIIKKNDVGSAFKMTENEKSVSFLNNYFIFQKKRDVDAKNIFNIHVQADLHKKYQEEQQQLMQKGFSIVEAKLKSSLLNEAKEMLRKWESGDSDIINLWKQMNSWVYEGFESTYKKIGVYFDKIYYESDTYLIGKEYVLNGLDSGVCYQKKDNSIWVNLDNYNLEEKLLLRSDGTAVYMTQDLGTAIIRKDEISFDKMIYVVGNEQNHHFNVLFSILNKMKFSWSDDLFHLSYGMVNLPDGKMKSREGIVVDIDDVCKIKGYHFKI